jgi:uncharacterized protein (UPF0147 family)
MATTPPATSAPNNVHALVELLRRRSYEEIRERMYDNPPGTPWFSACKTELDIRNSERLATSIVDNSRVSAKIRSAAENIEKLTSTLVEVTVEVADVVRCVKESSRRLEIATYVIIGVVIAQLFYVAFLVMGKR